MTKNFKPILEIRVKFLGGTNIKDACECMYDLALNSNKRVIGDFNGLRIEFDNADMFKRINGHD